MTMHLDPRLSSIETRKPKRKRLTKSQENKLVLECRDHNRQLRQDHRHDEQLTLSEYIDYVQGRVKSRPKKFVTYQPKEGYRRETPQIPSLGIGSGNAYAKESPVYSGTLIKGIAQTHKSNAVPVINQQEILDIRHMRR